MAEQGSGQTRPDTDQGLSSSRPPDRFREVRTWTLRAVTDLSPVRRELLAEVTAEHAEPQLALGRTPENMVLVASELATNALEHGLPPTVLTLGTDGRDYLLDVCDSDLDSVPVLPGERPVGAGGFGLLIARRLSQDVGWYADDRTKHVWAIFPAQG
ncbi:ATP-binding protein [Cellulomonas triticagri]|uniref:ATP-binding protein n=1 Tax=Cellulomonas triticagri TaxID=2483352 RepID=A0A3M2J6Z7_9CELL|nr:ATP-binding protein [Cellulomonas triticagri]RMI06715.1 ATP-binding protein [Cellulomonas triticagri]